MPRHQRATVDGGGMVWRGRTACGRYALVSTVSSTGSFVLVSPANLPALLRYGIMDLCRRPFATSRYSLAVFLGRAPARRSRPPPALFRHSFWAKPVRFLICVRSVGERETECSPVSPRNTCSEDVNLVDITATRTCSPPPAASRPEMFEQFCTEIMYLNGSKRGCYTRACFHFVSPAHMPLFAKVTESLF